MLRVKEYRVHQCVFRFDLSNDAFNIFRPLPVSPPTHPTKRAQYVRRDQSTAMAFLRSRLLPVIVMRKASSNLRRPWLIPSWHQRGQTPWHTRMSWTVWWEALPPNLQTLRSRRERTAKRVNKSLGLIPTVIGRGRALILLPTWMQASHTVRRCWTRMMKRTRCLRMIFMSPDPTILSRRLLTM